MIQNDGNQIKFSHFPDSTGSICDFWDFFLPGQLKKKENNSVKNGTAGNFNDNWLEKQHLAMLDNAQLLSVMTAFDE